MQRRWEEQLTGYVRASLRVINLGNCASQGVQMISKMVTVAILYFGAKAVIQGDLSVGQLVAFNMLANRVIQPVLRLAQNWQDFHQTKISIDRLGDILNAAPEPTFTPGRTALPAIKGAISFEHVTFRYRLDGPAVLHDVNIQILAGAGSGHCWPVWVRQIHTDKARPASLHAGNRPRSGGRGRSLHGRCELAAPASFGSRSSPVR